MHFVLKCSVYHDIRFNHLNDIFSNEQLTQFTDSDKFVHIVHIFDCIRTLYDIAIWTLLSYFIDIHKGLNNLNGLSIIFDNTLFITVTVC
jgi:hypothetical protein